MLTDIIVQPAGNKELGVFVRRAFAPGEFIFRRRHGPPVRNQDLHLLSLEDQMHICELDWETSAVLLPPGCYLNNACDPNAMRSGVKVFAWQAIRQGEEITIDYRLNSFDDTESICRCGSANCTGKFVNSFFALDEAQQQLYLPYAPKFIRAAYRRRQGQGKRLA
jgi:hypothetical protein